jgi:hypothetical protein
VAGVPEPSAEEDPAARASDDFLRPTNRPPIPPLPAASRCKHAGGLSMILYPLVHLRDAGGLDPDA